MIFNISENLKNRYQMATKRRPKAECNTTAAIMACIYTGHHITSPDGVLEEDFLMDILDSKEGREYLQKIAPGAKYNPWNDSYCIAWAVNKAANKIICKVVKTTIDDMVDHIMEGGAVVIGGGFLNGKTYGHFVCVVGVEKENKKTVKNIIIDDPYGNIWNNYKDHFDGNDIKIPVDKFIKLTFGKNKYKTMQFYYR